MKDSIKKYAPILRSLYLSVFATLMALVSSYLLHRSAFSAIDSAAADFVSFGQSLFVEFLGTATVVFAVVMIYYYFDNVDLFSKKDYFEMRDRLALIRKPQYLLSFAIAMLASVPTFAPSVHKLLTFLFPSADTMISRLIAVALMLAIRLIQLRILQSKWNTEIDYPIFRERAVFKRNRDMDSFTVRRLILLPIGYCAVFFALLYLVTGMMYTYLLGVLITLTSSFFWVKLIPYVLAIMLALLALRFLWNLKPRRKLIKYLKALEKRGLATVKYKGAKYFSSLFTMARFTVHVTSRTGAQFNCIVVTPGKINAPMFFKRDEFIVERGAHLRGGLMARGGRFARAIDPSTLGGKENPTNHVFGARTSHRLNFPELEGERTVIINPVPTSVFSLSETSSTAKPIDTGERMYGYTVYTATGFHNMVEREGERE